MKTRIIFIVTLAMLTSCLKKVEGTDDLNTNIFDRDYTGDKWFVITDAYSYFNDNGLPRVRVEAMIPEANMPGLKPSSVKLTVSVNGQPETLFNAILDENGNYLFYYDAVPGSGDYCLSAGIYVEEDQAGINTFTECTDL